MDINPEILEPLEEDLERAECAAEKLSIQVLQCKKLMTETVLTDCPSCAHKENPGNPIMIAVPPVHGAPSLPGIAIQCQRCGTQGNVYRWHKDTPSQLYQAIEDCINHWAELT